eukprot:COSAG02_NODE_6750_length_3384_cov_122.398174_1_plen_234_part_00
MGATSGCVPYRVPYVYQNIILTIVSCRELKQETDLFCSAPQKPAKTIGVRCVCPFAKRRHKSNHCYVIVNETGAFIKCHDEDCKDRSEKLDWVPRKQAEPMHVADSVEITDSTPEQPTVADEPEPEPEPSMDTGEDEKKNAISDLLAWKISHPFYRLEQLRQTAGDDMSVPLGFTLIGVRADLIKGRWVEIAEFTTTAKLCPNYPAGLVGHNDDSEIEHRFRHLPGALCEALP